MARIGLGSVVAACASLVAETAWSFEAKFIKVESGANLLSAWEISPTLTMFFATVAGVGAASICATLFAGR
ncbi:hypothetical protein [uncultured Albimonas sp.]|uniref:hypothetical protein n=1 Tax=uncultured Albimonas sp. TaxID=1331701 RepID=UPI0030ED02E1